MCFFVLVVLFVGNLVPRTTTRARNTLSGFIPSIQSPMYTTATLADISETLYDGSLGEGNQTLDQQGFTYAALDLSNYSVPTGLHTATNGKTLFDTTSSINYYAGFTGKADVVPTLDPSTGFKLTFTLQIEEETHTSNDRAGWSVILLGKDKKGIEVGFWTDTVWVQADDPLFTHSESVAFDTTGSLKTYELSIQGTTYTLKTGGTTLLTGLTRDYTAFDPPTGLPNFYQQANFVFLGDNSSRGMAKASISSVAIASFGKYKLVVERDSDGNGTITSTTKDISCGTDCQQDYDEGSSITLLATPSSDGSVFTGWSGDCQGATVETTVVMDKQKTCRATFTKKQPGVTVAPTTLNLVEGQPAGLYTIRLSAAPTATVDIHATAGEQVRVVPSLLSFNTTNWTEPHSVTVTVIDDTKIEGLHTETITHTITSNDSRYSKLRIPNVQVQITDNDVPTPKAAANFADGQPGSTFLVTGSDFPASSSVTVLINSGMAGVLSSDASGKIAFHFETTTAMPPGTYLVKVVSLYNAQATKLSQEVSANMTITLESTAPLRAKDTTISGPVFTEPKFIYLPLVERSSS
jgi:uncharacterized repeat protein (TIGR02543 family)